MSRTDHYVLTEATKKRLENRGKNLACVRCSQLLEPGHAICKQHPHKGQKILQ